MATSIVDYLNTKKTALDKIVDTTFWMLLANQDWLKRYFPIVLYPDYSLLVGRFTHKPVIASLIGQGAELPIHKPSATMTTQELGRILIGMEYLWHAQDYELMDKLMMQLAIAGGNASAYAGYFFGRVEDIQAALMRTVTYLACQIAQTAASAYVSPLTGVTTSLTYAANIEPTLFPAALTGANRWSQLTTGTGLVDLESITRAFFTIHGYYPSEVGIPRDDFRNLAGQASTKRAMIALITGHETTVNPAIDGVQVSEGDMTRLFAARVDRIPPMRILEGEFFEEQKSGIFTKKPFWTANTVTLFTDGMGEQALMPFAENDGQPGVRINNERMTPLMPRREIAQGMVSTIPFVSDARLLASQVIDGAS